ncbi:hypothetical protein COO60DRAFT_9518 [Scenedesmus sp. NREL 46B-D3]|nr:hypothetical protein COO60DRAFT_9518 [Scenedesmus sp. NREL 46B-D3]
MVGAALLHHSQATSLAIFLNLSSCPAISSRNHTRRASRTLLLYMQMLRTPEDNQALAFDPDPAVAQAIAAELVYKLPHTLWTGPKPARGCTSQRHQGTPLQTHASKGNTTPQPTNAEERHCIHRCCTGVVTRAQPPVCVQPAVWRLSLQKAFCSCNSATFNSV